MTWRKVTAIIISLSFFLVACNNITTIETEEIRLMNFQAFGKADGELIKVISDENEVKMIVKLIDGASKESGSVDMPEGDYTVELVSEDGEKEAYHLWLEDAEAKGTIMAVKDTSTIYTLSKNKKEKLRTALIN